MRGGFFVSTKTLTLRPRLVFGNVACGKHIAWLAEERICRLSRGLLSTLHCLPTATPTPPPPCVTCKEVPCNHQSAGWAIVLGRLDWRGITRWGAAFAVFLGSAGQETIHLIAHCRPQLSHPQYYSYKASVRSNARKFIAPRSSGCVVSNAPIRNS